MGVVLEDAEQRPLVWAKAEYPDLFLETQIMAETGGENPRKTVIKPITREEADLWLLKRDVKPLVLLYPQLPTAKSESVGPIDTSTPTWDRPTAEPDHHEHPDDPPF